MTTRYYRCRHACRHPLCAPRCCRVPLSRQHDVIDAYHTTSADIDEYDDIIRFVADKDVIFFLQNHIFITAVMRFVLLR